MVIFIVFIILALSSSSVVALCRRFRRRQAGVDCWVAFGGLFAGGAALGIWCALFCEYRIRDHFRVGSFPISIVFFHLEEGQWVDYPVPKFQAWLTILANISAIVSVTTLPMWLLSWWRQRYERRLA
jgi:hypothetical protein